MQQQAGRMEEGEGTVGGGLSYFTFFFFFDSYYVFLFFSFSFSFSLIMVLTITICMLWQNRKVKMISFQYVLFCEPNKLKGML